MGPKKDELLHQILQEISDENNTINNSYQEKKTQDKNKSLSGVKKIENILIAMIVMLIIFVLFHPEYETNSIDHNDTRKNKSSISKVGQPKLQKQTVPNTEKNEPLDKEVKSEKMLQTIISENKKTKTQEREILNIPNLKTQREKAKEMLMEQMEN